MPNEVRSANESSCLPKELAWCMSLATFPSNVSMTKASTMSDAARLNWSFEAAKIDMTPQTRLPTVKMSATLTVRKIFKIQVFRDSCLLMDVLAVNQHNSFDGYIRMLPFFEKTR